MKISATAILLLFINIIYAQTKTEYSIKGSVADSSGLALDNTSILLLNAKDSSVIKGAVPSKTGEFIFSNLKEGSYLISASKTGFKTFVSQSITINSTQSVVTVPPIKLYPESKMLSAVTVTAKKPLIEQADDKITYNTESDPLSASETALDILRKTPLVTVDGQGNITVNGQTNFKVLLNGRETSMFARNVSDALKGFPGKLITKIEIITAPSAKYDAEGVGGLINIITKKKVAGYNGSLGIVAATTGFRNISGNINLKYGKWGLSGYLGSGGNYHQKNITGETIEALHPVSYYKRISEGRGLSKNHWLFGNMELNYEIDSLRTLSAYAAPSGGSYKNQTTSDFSLVLPNMVDTIKSRYIANNDNRFPSVNTGIDYIRKYSGKPDKEFDLRLNGDFGHDDTYSNSEQDNPYVDRFIINNNKAINRQYTIQTDFAQPLPKNKKLELGAKFITRHAFSDYQSFVKYDPSESYKTDIGNTDYFNYQQNVGSLYASYNFKVKTYSFRLGVRSEQTILNGDFRTSSTKVKQSYNNILPNILISKKFKKGQNLSLSYNLRLARPYIWNLNPFVNNIDTLNLVTGNPHLKPQTFHTVAFQYRFSAGQSFVNLGLTNSYSDNKIIQYLNFNSNTGVNTSSPQNIGRNFQSAFSISINTKFNSHWTVNGNGRIAYDIIKNAISTSSVQRNSGFSGNGFFNTNYTIGKHFATSAYLGFYKNPPSLQAKYATNLYYGAGMNYKVFNDKLTFNLSIVNFHEKYYKYEVHYIDENFNRTTHNSYPYRALQANISWNFGKLKDNVSKKKGVTNDDLLGK